MDVQFCDIFVAVRLCSFYFIFMFVNFIFDHLFHHSGITQLQISILSRHYVCVQNICSYHEMWIINIILSLLSFVLAKLKI